jgi:hypothetical protein
MSDHKILIAAVILAGLAVTGAKAATPCTGVDQTLTAAEKPVLAQAAAKQLGLPTVDVLDSFHVESWQIIYVATESSDNAFLFYANDPTTHKYVALWAGAAMASEKSSIDGWALKNAPGIPAKLADCFAWHVTQDRSK